MDLVTGKLSLVMMILMQGEMDDQDEEARVMMDTGMLARNSYCEDYYLPEIDHANKEAEKLRKDNILMVF